MTHLDLKRWGNLPRFNYLIAAQAQQLAVVNRPIDSIKETLRIRAQRINSYIETFPYRLDPKQPLPEHWFVPEFGISRIGSTPFSTSASINLVGLILTSKGFQGTQNGPNVWEYRWPDESVHYRLSMASDGNHIYGLIEWRDVPHNAAYRLNRRFVYELAREVHRLCQILPAPLSLLASVPESVPTMSGIDEPSFQIESVPETEPSVSEEQRLVEQFEQTYKLMKARGDVSSIPEWLRRHDFHITDRQFFNLRKKYGNGSNRNRKR